MLQLQFLCNASTVLPKRPNELAEMFMPLLEKLSASSKRKTIIVVDNVDLIKVGQCAYNLTIL